MQEGDDVYVAIVTKGRAPLFSDESVEQVRNECRKADEYLGVKKTIFMDFPASMLEEVPRYELNEAFINLVQEIRPDILYLPHRGDMQLDHKITVDATMVALRPKYNHVVKRVYAYETLSETGWDIPNVENEFIPTSYNEIEDFIGKKIEAMQMFKSQIAEYPNPRSIESIQALAVYRGTMVGVRMAEAFIVIREIRN